jgi:hypothetical protein
MRGISKIFRQDIQKKTFNFDLNGNSLSDLNLLKVPIIPKLFILIRSALIASNVLMVWHSILSGGCYSHVINKFIYEYFII